jgi:hypothetical protein
VVVNRLRTTGLQQIVYSVQRCPIPVSSLQLLPQVLERETHSTSQNHKHNLPRSQQVTEIISVFFFILVCEAIGTAATPDLLCQPRVMVKMTVEKQMECRLAWETEVLGENLPQRHFSPSQNYA